MGIISRTVKIRPSHAKVKYYKEKGYDAQYGQELEVRIEDLSTCSVALVDVTCDYCGKLKEPMRYVDYNAQTKNGTKKCCCLDCVPLKREEVFLEKYGYKNAMQVPDIQEKIQKTNIERYGSKSPSGNVVVREKQKQTLMQHYGVENPSLSKELQEKRKQVFIEKYGVDNPLLLPEIRQKAKQTIFERYGVENVSQNKEIQEKRTQTFLNKFGVIAPLQNKECLDKLKQTNLEKYGVEFVMQLEDTHQKSKETSLERYGYEYPMQSPEILEKWFEKNGAGFVRSSRQQKYLCNLYNGILNHPLKCFALDIFLPEYKFDIEFDGSGHKMSIALGSITEEEFEQKELYRNVAIKKNNIKQMRIISTKDLLPSDAILLQMLQDSIQYFLDFPNHSWISYDIDKSMMFNAEHKSGTPYNFGPLRTIKDSDLDTQINNKDI